MSPLEAMGLSCKYLAELAIAAFFCVANNTDYLLRGGGKQIIQWEYLAIALAHAPPDGKSTETSQMWR